MATLVLTAVGTAIGGPLGGALGSLLGSQIDGALFGPADREGPRLQELSVTTSSYGTPVPRHFGTMRAAGSIIWATDLVESSEEAGGGKGQPSVTTYSYSTSFAVALASRPVAAVRRIWADGNLLRGSAGDLKVGGVFRFHSGHGDQQPDPLIAADKGAACPAFRGLAYCVFEDLQLGDFGNRIPALTFEIVADDGAVSLQSIVSPVVETDAANRVLAGLQGYSDTGGPLQTVLDSVDRVYPLACDASGTRLTFFDGHPAGEPVARLPEAAVDLSREGFGSVSGRASQRRADAAQAPGGLRYYDVDRDYQAGLQRAGGRAQAGRSRIVEFPGALVATKARKLADDAAERAGWSQERMAYRVAQLDPAIGPGQIVSVPGKPGKWRIEAWEWRETGLELELLRLPYLRGAETPTDAGTSASPKDAVASPTILRAVELPWDGEGSMDQRQVFAAPSSATSGWTGATLYAERGGSLVPIGGTGTRRSITGTTFSPLAPCSALFIDRQATLDVLLDAVDLVLPSATPEDLASGANRAVVGEEIIQFCHAKDLGEGQWRLSGLLRGRGGTEHIAAHGTPAGAGIILLDRKPIALQASEVGESPVIAAIGLADTEAVVAPIMASGRSRQPLMPVHGRAMRLGDGDLMLRWIRRSRGSWSWSGTVDVPLNEQAERYEVGLGDLDQPVASWERSEPELTLGAAELAPLEADHSGKPLWVRQVGSHARSAALFLTILD